METDLLKLAAEVAVAAHNKQTRRYTNEPYINHPMRVARAIESKGGSEIEIAAAILHDVPEDTPIQSSILRRLFPHAVVDIVDVLTRNPDENYLQYILRIMENESAVKIKIEDLHDNLETLPPGTMRDKYLLTAHILIGNA